MSDCSKIPYGSCTAATIAMRAIRRKKTTRGLKAPDWHLLLPDLQAMAPDLEVGNAGATLVEAQSEW